MKMTVEPERHSWFKRATSLIRAIHRIRSSRTSIIDLLMVWSESMENPMVCKHDLTNDDAVLTMPRMHAFACPSTVGAYYAERFPRDPWRALDLALLALGLGPNSLYQSRLEQAEQAAQAAELQLDALRVSVDHMEQTLEDVMSGIENSSDLRFGVGVTDDPWPEPDSTITDKQVLAWRSDPGKWS